MRYSDSCSQPQNPHSKSVLGRWRAPCVHTAPLAHLGRAHVSQCSPFSSAPDVMRLAESRRGASAGTLHPSSLRFSSCGRQTGQPRSDYPSPASLVSGTTDLGSRPSPWTGRFGSSLTLLGS
ncbi:hypothetical protein OH77DRAFT_332947 [Trametes cingulata]|nr:hypothetical protein OH77DRAFT_332947 [Trametes cingulata]